MHTHRWLLGAGLACACAPAVLALPPIRVVPLTLEGEGVEGYPGATVSEVIDVSVNNDGVWAARVRAIEDLGGGQARKSVCLLRSGQLMMRERGTVDGPGGPLTLRLLRSVAIANSGETVSSLFVGDNGTFGDGLFVRDRIVAFTDDPTEVPGLDPASTWVSFGDPDIGNGRHVVVRCEVNDPTLDRQPAPGLAMLRLGTGSTVIERRLVALYSQPAPGLPGLTLQDFDPSSMHRDVNNLGGMLYSARLSADSASDGAIYLDNILVAREGDLSPLPGYRYRDFVGSQFAMDLADSGQWILRTHVQDELETTQILICSGAVHAREGQASVEMGGIIESLGAWDVQIDDAGRPYWYVDTATTFNTDTAIMRGNQPLVRETLTQVQGRPLLGFATGEQWFNVSDNGKFVVFVGIVPNPIGPGSIEGAFLVELCPADFNGADGVTVQDLYDFLTAFSMLDQRADFNVSATVSVQDVFDYISAWQDGCNDWP
jgi:hypothetical protein